MRFIPGEPLSQTADGSWSRPESQAAAARGTIDRFQSAPFLLCAISCQVPRASLDLTSGIVQQTSSWSNYIHYLLVLYISKANPRYEYSIHIIDRI